MARDLFAELGASTAPAANASTGGPRDLFAEIEQKPDAKHPGHTPRRTLRERRVVTKPTDEQNAAPEANRGPRPGNVQAPLDRGTSAPVAQTGMGLGLGMSSTMQDVNAAPETPQQRFERESNDRSDGRSLTATRAPEATVGNIASGLATSLGEAFTQTERGAYMAFEENTPLAPGDTEARRQARVDQALREIRQSQNNQALARPDIKSTAGNYAYDTADSVLQSTPAIVGGILAGVATGPVGGTAVGLGLAGGQTGAQAYGKYRERGATPGMAAIGAAGEGAIEIGTELLPMGALVEKFGKVGARRLIGEVLGKEMVGEQLATFTQDAIDTAIANPNKTWKQYWDERPDAAFRTGLAVLAQTGLIGGASRAVQAIGSRLDNNGRLIGRNPSDTRAAAPGVRETAVERAATPTEADVASPLPTEAITAGKVEIAKATAGGTADAGLQSAGMPKVGKRVVIDHGDGTIETGTMEDWFEADDGKGVVVKLDNGRTMREYTDTLADAGVTIREEAASQQSEALPDLYHGGRSGLTPQDIEIVRANGQKQGKKGRIFGGFYATGKVDEARGYAEMAGEGNTTYKVELDPNAKVERKDGDITRLSPQTIDEYRARGVDVIIGTDPRGRTEYAIINQGAIRGLTDLNAAASPIAEADAIDARLAAMAQNSRLAPTGATSSPGAETEQAAPPARPAGSPVADGGAVIRSIFGDGVRITSQRRQKTDKLTQANPGSWHAKSNAAVDMAPIPGTTFEATKARIEAAGYQLIEAIDEVKNPSKHATGPHWHFVIGEGGARTADAAAAPAAAAEPESEDDTAPAAPRDTNPALIPADATPEGKAMRGPAIDEEWSSFPPQSGTLAIPRGEMPQIKAEHRGAMVNFMNARGVAHEEVEVPASSLKPTQAEYSTAKVEKAKGYEGGNRAILISADGHVLDGHHQWMAALDKGENIRAIRLDAPVRDLVNLAHEFPSSTVEDGASAAAPAAGADDVVATYRGQEQARFRVVKVGDGNLEGEFTIHRIGEDGSVMQRWNGRHMSEGSTEGRFRTEDAARRAAQMQADRIEANFGGGTTAAPEAAGLDTLSDNEVGGFTTVLIDSPSTNDGVLATFTPEEKARLAEVGIRMNGNVMAAADVERLMAERAARQKQRYDQKRESAAPAPQAPASTARVEPTPSGKGVAVIGASEAELAAIAREVPQAKATKRSDGAWTYSLKHADAIRAAIAGVGASGAGPVQAASAPRMSRDEIANRLAESLGHTRGDMHDRIADAIHGKDFWTLGGMLLPHNKKSRKVFTEATGIKLPESLAGTEAALRDWAGISQSEIDRVRSEADAKRADERAERERDNVRRDAEAVRVRHSDGAEMSGREWVDARLAEGYDRLVNTSTGAVPKWAIGNAEGRGYPIKKELLAYARQALEHTTPRNLTDQEIADLEGIPLEDVIASKDLFRTPEEREAANGTREPSAVGTAPEHAQVGVDDRELAEIVRDFDEVRRSQGEGDQQVTHVFDPPAKGEIVRLQDKVKVYVDQFGWMTPAEAKAKIAEWKAHADKQGGPQSPNRDKVVLSLFDLTGKWSQPWVDAGYQVYRFDIQDDPEVGDVHNFSTEFFSDWFGDFDGQDIYAILAACPCTDFASSGARHFAAKDADGRTVASVKLVQQTLATIEYFKPAVWAIENPVGRIEKLGGLPPWRLSFDPNHLGETYTKKTLIWGRFNADLPIAPADPVEGSKMHSQYGGKSMATKNARSATPEGFAYGFFMANNAVDHPVLAIHGKYDRLDRDLIDKAVKAGVTAEQIDRAVEDPYYMEQDDEAANQAIRDLIEERRRAKMGARPVDRSAAIIIDPAAGTVKTVPLGKDAQADRAVLRKRLADGLAGMTPVQVENVARAMGIDNPAMGRETWASYYTQRIVRDSYALDVLEREMAKARQAPDNTVKAKMVPLAEDQPTPDALENEVLALTSDQYEQYLRVLKPPRNPNRNAITSRAAQIQRQFNTMGEAAMRKALASVVGSGAKTSDGRIGLNNRNLPVYEDENGVRSYVERGIRITEPVEMRPVRGAGIQMSINPAARGGEFLTAEERAATQTSSIANIKPTDQATIDLLARMAEAEDAGRYTPVEIGSQRVKMMIAEGLIIENKGKSIAAWITSEKGRALLDQAGVPHAQSPKESTSKFADNKLFTEDKVAAAKARMAERMKRLNSGVDPEMLIDGITIAGAYIEAGVRNFAAFAKQMRDDFGPKIQPYLLSFWEGTRYYPGLDTEGMTDPATSKAMHEMMLAEVPVQETQAEPAPAAAPAQAQREDVPASNPSDPVMALRDRLVDGERFATIVEARKALSEITGEQIRPGTPEAKRADETIEAAVVQAARKIAAQGKDALTTFRELVDLYQRQPNLAVRTSTSIEQQAYSTPVPLAYLASKRAGITQDTTVYEPSAGNGALLIDARATYVTANELNPERAAQLRAIYRGANITERDATTFVPPGPQRDVVIANPPFGVVKDDEGDTRMFDMGDGYVTREIDHAISLLALDSMKNNGKAVLIVGSIAKTITDPRKRADAYNGKAKREFYYRLYSEYNVTDHFTVAGELYAKQGAGWPVDVIVIEGRGKSALKLPAVQAPRVYDSWAALENEVERGPSVQSQSGEQVGNPALASGRPESSDGSDRTGGRAGRPDRLERPAAADQPRSLREGSPDGQPGGRGLDDRQAAGDALTNGNDRDRAGSRAPDVKRAPVAPVAGENERQVTYQPASTSTSLETLVPVNMQTAIGTALDNLQARVGGVDAFVADRLGYKPSEIPNVFSAEQVDALALAIDNMERGAGFIIGDQTGIGKGRVVAGIIRYALKSGRMPIFVTEKPNLYSDMYRDMNDIGVPEMLGRPVDILMTNAAEKVPLNEDGSEVLKTGPAASHNALLNRVADGDRQGVDVLFTTYSQLQSLKGEFTPRQRAIAKLAPGSILIFDESHNAGGQGKKDNERKTKKQKEAEAAGLTAPNRAEFARQIARQAHGVFFSSATYAKRPEVMDLYASTDMRYAVADLDKLADAIGKGGIPMQQIVASMLTEAGQYVRRERSFDGVEYRTPAVEVDRKAYSQFTGVLRAIQNFQEENLAEVVEAIADEIRNEAQAISFDGSIGNAGATSTNFTAIMHNLVEQMLLAMKAKPAAELAVQAIENGQKPVITVANTMGSFLEEYATENNIGNGQPMPLDFRSLLVRYLDRTRRLAIKRPYSKDKAEYHYITDDELGPAGLAAYNEVRRKIEEMDLGDVPVSPVDYIRNRIMEAGYKVGEITGRTAALDYSGKTPRYRIRPGSEKSISGRRAAITGFNSGTVDAMILNQAGSTGLSLHASKTFKDQRPRVMIIAQAERNIDTHMQMLGRIHRTGQVVLPAYDQLVAAVPAEMRPAAVLAKKMASLNANTTGARGSAVTAEEIPDFMNEYGDEIAARMMEEDDFLHVALGAPLKESKGDNEGYDRDDAARKVTGRLMLLPLEEQEAFYERFLAEYQDYLAQKEAAGESALEAKTLPLDARTIDKEQVIAPTHPTSPFGAGVDREVFDVRRLGKPMKPEQVMEGIADALGTAAPATADEDARKALEEKGRQQNAELYREQIAKFDAYSRAQLDSLDDAKKYEANAERFRANRIAFTSLMRTVYPGAGIAVINQDGDMMAGVVMEVEHKTGTKNPLALGSYRAHIAPVGASGKVTIPFSQLFTREFDGAPGQREVQIITHADGLPMMQAFAEAQVEAREKRTILTGNILAAFEHTGGKGQIVNFVDSEGNVRPGLMMKRGYDYAKDMARRPVSFRTPEQVMAWLALGKVATGDGVSVERKGGSIEVITNASKSSGGKYFLDPSVRRIVGGDFIKRSNGMVADAPADRGTELVRALLSLGANFTAKTDLEQAREIVAGGADQQTKQSIPTDLPTVSAEIGDWGKLPAPGKQRLMILRQRVQRWYEGVVGTTVRSSDGKTVRFNRAGMDKTLRGGEELLLRARAIPKIIQRGKLVSTEPANRRGFKAVHKYAANVRMDGEAMPLVVSVREAADGTFHYSLNRYVSPDAPVGTGSADPRASNPALEGGAGDVLNLDVLQTSVNPGNADPSAELQARLEGYGIARKVALRVVDSLGGAAGDYSNALIRVATDTTQAGSYTLDHEAVHAMRALGLINQSEWAVLSAKARRDTALMRSIRARYARLDAEGQTEEAVADMFARYQRGDYQAEGTAARVFKALRSALEAIGNYLRGRGLQTAEGVMQRVASGEVGARNGQVSLDGSQRESRPEVTDMVSLGGTDPTWRGKMAEAYEQWRTRLQDRYMPLLKVQREIEQQTGKPLPLSRNPYMGEELMTGRIGAQLESLAEDHVEPLFDAMHAEGVTLEELETYLYARHAPERNARIAEINPEFDEGSGSGMTDIEARAIMNRIKREGRMPAMQRLADRVDALRELALDTQVRTGLISKADADELRATYKHYVPLRGFKEVEDADPALADRINRSGGGINVRGRESKAAYGRRSQADSPLAYLIMQAEGAIVRGETNLVAQQFVNLAKANPDEDFWQVNKVTAKQRINEETGLVERYLSYNLAAADADWTVSAKFGGVERRVTMNRANPAARRLADAMRNLTQHQLDWVTLHLGKLNRWLSSVNTSYNPEFVITNAFRDLQTAAFNLSAEEVKGLTTGVLKDYRAALVASLKGEMGRPSGEWGKWYTEFASNGGRVSFNQIENIDEIKKRIARIAEMSAAKAGEGGMALQAKRMFFGAAEWIDNANSGVENAVRLAVYKNARERGLSPARAASMAKNVTVNFNRRGTAGPALNAAYLFFNASVQGSARIIQSLRSPRVRKMLAGVMITGALVEMLNAFMSADDDDGEAIYDKIAAFEKERNIILMLPGGQSYLKIPMPYGYNVFWNAGRSVAEIGRRGGARWKETSADFISSVVDAFNPIGGADSLLNLVSPTVTDPIVDLALNRDFTGKPIMPDENQYGPQEPDNQRYWGNVSPAWKAVTDFLNEASGGDNVTPGAIDLSPETLEYLSGVAFGSLGSSANRIANLVGKGVSPDEEVTANDLPFARKLYGSKPSWYDKGTFYERLGEVEQQIAYTKGYIEGGDIEQARAYARDHLAVLQLEGDAKSARSDMRKIRKAKREVVAAHERGTISDETYRSDMRKIGDAEKLVIRQFNTRWNQVVTSGEGPS